MSEKITTRHALYHYRILKKIGAGGMGEVYLAKDARLDRHVAIKLLLAELTKSEEHLSRFRQEARTASSLNHPNIITVHEIGQADGAHFIVTEFIDGVTLRHHMSNARMKVEEALDIAIQATSALTAAHAAGIVHRDIKPENIMLRKDGYVKVLDFGLAKLTENTRHLSVSLEASTAPNVNTGPGAVIGTVLYMSPEQLRGIKVDARTDIWSLGVVLYEMIAGRTPFEGATNSEISALILDREPAPLFRYSMEIPPEMQRIVMKAMRKDREARYQTAKDLLLDLKSLKQDLEFDLKTKNSRPPGIKGVATANQTGSAPAVGTSATEVARPTNSIEFIIGGIKHRRKRVILLLLVLTMTTSWWLYGKLRPPAPPQAEIRRLTYISKVTDAAISPDGKYIVYLIDDGGQQSLWVRQVNTSEKRQLVAPANDTYQALTFSPDGSYVYCARYEGQGTVSALYRIAVWGDSQKKIMEDVDSAITFSPDGKRFAFVRCYPGRGEDALMVANADGTQEQVLATRKRPEFFKQSGFFYYLRPSWSPDGKSIACAAGSYIDSYMNVVEVQLENGAEKPATSRKWFNIRQVTWLRDGSGLLITAKEQASSPSQVWLIRHPSGEVRKITNDTVDYSAISVSDDSDTLATIQTEHLASIWVGPAGEASRAQEITAAGKYNESVAWSPDGKIVYASAASGKWEIWMMDADGSHQHQLTFDGDTNRFPAVSTDGRYIVFASDRSGAQNIWRMDLDGRNLKQLTDDGMSLFPHCSPRGWVVYTSYRSGSGTLWKVPIEGGHPTQVTDKLSSWPTWSPDGKTIACTYREELGAPFEIGVIPIDGGRAARRFSVPQTVWLPNLVRWTADGHEITYVDTRNGVSNIWGQPLDGGPPMRLTDFTSDLIFYFDWSRDGTRLVCSRGIITRDVVLISGFK